MPKQEIIKMQFAIRTVAIWMALLPLLLVSSLEAAGRQFLAGHVPEGVAESKAVGRVPAANQMRLAVGLPLRNQSELQLLMKNLADPTSPEYRQYLTPAQFAERFGPTEDDYQALATFFEANGISVTGRHPNRTILDVSGTVADIENTFQVKMITWNHPTRGNFFAPDRAPSVDAGVTILDVSGLDNFVLPRPMDLKSHPLSNSKALATGSGPAGLFIGNDYRSAYAPAVTLTGAGQSVGLFELDGFYASDVQSNFKQAGLPAVPVKTVLLDGFNGAPGSGNVEVILDIMMAAYMAPGVSNIIVYEGENPDDVLNRMATDNLASQLSSSWGWSPIDAMTDQIFRQMVAQGQSLFQASGDSGAYHGAIMPPADDPNLTAVGGTSLTTSGAGGSWQSEATWSDSGGGVSTTWQIPSYQQSSAMTAAGGSGSMRNIPDVALLADIQIFLVCNNGQSIEVGGTSAAAPLWAGFMALANQQASSSALPRVGFLNPPIYAIGAAASYQTDLHDIVSGNNSGFNALPGYDLATGWGSPAGQALINSLTGTANAPGFGLSLSASTLSIVQGASGVTTITVSQQPGFSSAVNLSVSGLPAGVTASFSPASALTTSTLTLLASGSAVASTSTLTITGISGTLTSTSRLVLTVTAPASFTIAATPAVSSLAQGGSSISTIAVTPQGGFTGVVVFTASGLPSGVTATFGPQSLAGAGTLTLAASSSAAIGTSIVTITGTSGTLFSTTTINLTVNAAMPYTIAASPASLSLLPGTKGITTITVTPQGTFNGTVAFSVTGLPAGVTAAFSPASAAKTSTLTLTAATNAAPGTFALTVIGTSGITISKATIALTVAAPASFTLSATPASLSVTPGSSGSSTIAINAANGFNAAVLFSASGLPTGVTAAFGPVTAARTSTVTFTAASTAAAASATVTITGTSGTLVSKTAIALTIAPAPGFSLSASPSTLSIAQGATGNSTITLLAQNGFAAGVTLTMSAPPAGVTGSFSAGATSASCILTLTATNSAAPGPSTVTITGKSGSLTQTVSIALTVQPSTSYRKWTM